MPFSYTPTMSLSYPTFQNLGRELDRRRVKSQLEYYVKTENELAMVNFLLASRGVDAIDRQAAYSALLNIYCKCSMY